MLSPAYRTFAGRTGSLSLGKTESAVQTFGRYHSEMLPDSFFNVFQMPVDIFLRDVPELGDIPRRPLTGI